MQNRGYGKSDSFLLPFQGLIKQSWHDKLQTPQSQEKKGKNSQVGKKTEVWRVGGSAFPSTFGWVYFNLFFQPGDFFNTTWAI